MEVLHLAWADRPMHSPLLHRAGLPAHASPGYALFSRWPPCKLDSGLSPSFSLGLTALCIPRSCIVRACPPMHPRVMRCFSTGRHASSIPGCRPPSRLGCSPYAFPVSALCGQARPCFPGLCAWLDRDQYSKDSMYFMYFTTIRAILNVIASSNTRRSRPVLFWSLSSLYTRVFL